MNQTSSCLKTSSSHVSFFLTNVWFVCVFVFSLQADTERRKTFSTAWVKLWMKRGKKATRYIQTKQSTVSLTRVRAFALYAILTLPVGCRWVLSKWTRSQPGSDRPHQDCSWGKTLTRWLLILFSTDLINVFFFFFFSFRNSSMSYNRNKVRDSYCFSGGEQEVFLGYLLLLAWSMIPGCDWLQK